MARGVFWSCLVYSLSQLISGWNCALNQHHLCAEVSNYIVLIDAGSTGSRIYVYNYPPRLLEATDLPYIVHSPLTRPRSLGSYSIRPGLSSFAEDASNISSYLHELTMKAKDILETHGQQTHSQHVPLYLGATAGMRVLGRKQRDYVLHQARRYFGSDDCPFEFSLPEQARVISGEEEGVFGWLAVNDAQNSLSANAGTTYGLLDMGGASAQIAFIPKEPSVLANFFPMHFGQFSDGPIHLYSHSFQGFGYVLAFQRVSAHLYAAAKSNRFCNPCLSRGLVWNVTEEFGVSVVTDDANVVRDSGPIQMIGTGHFLKCKEVAKTLLVKERCYMEPCSILGMYQPSLDHSRFVAVGEYSTAYFLTLAAYATTPTLVTLRDGGIRHCDLPHYLQEEMNTGKVLSCWRTVWTYTFLTDGLGVTTNNTLVHMAAEPDWTQGQAIYETNFFPYRLVQAVGGLAARQERMQLSSMQLSIVIFITALSSALLSVAISRGTWRRIRIRHVGSNNLRCSLLNV
jgi:apyrase|mmetsp:Transcript_89645/g.141530  ORF Transcript_89645/g.141530 Transcript_89645/m.141530 type:complete len:513 (-) Transcript_89645:247-1785(-)